jgi:hypothetical protein
VGDELNSTSLFQRPATEELQSPRPVVDNKFVIYP